MWNHPEPAIVGGGGYSIWRVGALGRGGRAQLLQNVCVYIYIHIHIYIYTHTYVHSNNEMQDASPQPRLVLAMHLVLKPKVAGEASIKKLIHPRSWNHCKFYKAPRQR